MNPAICDGTIPSKIVNKEVQPFISILVEKIEELNYRARDISLNSLIGIFKGPQVHIQMLIDKIMDITNKGTSPSKAPWRIILGRLDILQSILKQLGYDQSKWDWVPVFENLVSPSLFNPNPDVRQIAIEVICMFYQLIGDPIR